MKASALASAEATAATMPTASAQRMLRTRDSELIDYPRSFGRYAPDARRSAGKEPIGPMVST